MHKFPQHFENVSEFNVNDRSDAHEGRSQTQSEMRREFKNIGKDRIILHFDYFSAQASTLCSFEALAIIKD